MKLYYPSGQITLAYAAEEFRRLAAAVDPALPVETVCVPRLPAAPGREEILLGLMEELGRPAEDLQDSFLEDIPDVEVSGCTGVIAGSNPKFRRSLPSPV